MSGDDLQLLPVANDEGGFGGFLSKELSTDEDEQRLSSSRWLLVSSRGDGITTHTAFYRPELAPNQDNTISGLGLPSTLIDAAGSRLLELSIHLQGDPDALLRSERGNAQELSALLAGFTFTPVAPGPVALDVVLQETLADADPGSSPAGSLRLFTQTLLFEVASPGDGLTDPVAPIALADEGAGSRSFLEGRGLLLLENLGDEATEALNDSVDQAAVANLQLQLQLLGYPDDFVARLVSLPTLA